jgi:DNA ligase-1
MDDFKMMQEYVDKMKSTSSILAKEKILREYKREPFVRSCVLYTLDPFLMYGVTSKQVKELESKGSEGGVIAPYKHLFGLLNDLADRYITGHDACYHIMDYVDRNRKYATLIYGILDKNIKTRANATLVNKVWGKGFIPKFDVALAKSYDDVEVDYSMGWYASRKLDGLRCICKIDKDGVARFYSRKGKEFFTLGVLKEAVGRSGLSDIVLDGELCIVKDGLEDFKQIIKEYNKKDHTIAMPKFFVFDVLSDHEFYSGGSNYNLIQRLDRVLNCDLPDGFEMLDQRWVLSDEEVAEALAVAESQGHEGVILRKNTGYKGKRSGDILKVKKFKDAEFVVKAIENGKMRFIEDGQDVERTTMTAAVIEYKGNDVGVGSGWSKEERERFYDVPARIIGKTITVRYKKESTNSDGKVSLQFPTIKAIYLGERSV